jgi:hypothetical protein
VNGSLLEAQRNASHLSFVNFGSIAIAVIIDFDDDSLQKAHKSRTLKHFGGFKSTV